MSSQSSVLPVRILHILSMGITKILPSPIEPVCTEETIFFDDRIDRVAADHSFNFYFWNKAHHIFGTPVDFSMFLLTPKSFDLTYGHSGNSKFAQAFLEVVKLERFDSCFNFFSLSFPAVLHFFFLQFPRQTVCQIGKL